MKNVLIAILFLAAFLSETAYSVDFLEIKKMMAGDAQAGDLFGYSVSVSGDYAIVGAYLEDSPNSDAGAAYIFYKNQGGLNNWGEVIKLTASDAQANDYFGRSVSISGNYALVGADGEDQYGNLAGAAYMFAKDQGGSNNWGEVKKLTAFYPLFEDYFGRSVSVSGNYAIVGSPNKDLGDLYAGAAHIYYKDQGGTDNWGGVQYIYQSDPIDFDYFGESVSISGNYAVVGAYGEESGNYNESGSAYIFYKDQGGTDNWGQFKKLTANIPNDYDYFGRSVSISGDYILVGANGEDTGGSSAGAGYIFYKDQGGSGNWGQAKKLTAGDAQASDNFGRSVSIAGDYAILGADGEDAGGSSAGAGYIFYKNQGGSGNWGEFKKLTAGDDSAADSLGKSVSISGDYAFLGANGEDAGGSSAGAAYMFQKFLNIPTLPEWGMIAMGVLFAGIGGWFVFRKLG